MNFDKDSKRLAMLAELNARYYVALTQVVPGLANDSLVREFQAVIEGLEQLVLEGLPSVVNRAEIRYKIAKSQERIAFIYSLQGKLSQAKHYYELAIYIFLEIGKLEQIDACKENICSLEFREAGDIDREVQRTYINLEHTPAGTLEHIKVLVELGSILISAGDDFEAEKRLRTAESELQKNGYPLPTAEDLESAFQQTMHNIDSGIFTEGPSQHMLLMEVESLYRQIYTCLVSIYQRTQPEKALEYLEHLKHMNTGGPDDLRKLSYQISKFEEDVKAKSTYATYLQQRFQQLCEQQQEMTNDILMHGADEQTWQKFMEQTDLVTKTAVNGVKDIDDFISYRNNLDGTSDGFTKYAIIDPLLLRQDIDALEIENKSRSRDAPRDDLLQKALALEMQARQIGNPEFIVISLIRRASILVALQKDVEAIQVLEEARSELGNVERYNLEVIILSMLARIHANRQEWNKVSSICRIGIALVESYRYKVTSQYQQSAYLRSRLSLYALGARSAYELKNYPLMLEQAELSKSHRLVLRDQEQVTSFSSESSTAEEFRLVCEQIATARAHGEPEKEDLLERRRLLWDLLFIQRFQAKTGKRLPEFNLEQIQALLDKDEVIIYYYWFDNHNLLIVTIDQQHLCSELHPIDQNQRSELEKLALFILELQGSSGHLKTIQKFSENLLPIAGKRLLEGKQRVLISPHRLLHAIPFHALKWNSDYFIQRFAITYIPNLSSLLLSYSPSPQNYILTLGICDYQLLTENPIKEAEQEIEDIKNLYTQYNVNIYELKGIEATRYNIMELIKTGDMQKFQCLHFATHGKNVNSDTPMESYLCLQNSKLEGLEIANWDLNADLVVLSACCSGQRPICGRGMSELPGDDLFGLQAAFFAAGAKLLLCSLWPVDSHTARTITLSFHRAIIQGKVPEVALQAAIQDHLKTAGLGKRGVYYWAPFFLSAMGRARK